MARPSDRPEVRYRCTLCGRTGSRQFTVIQPGGAMPSGSWRCTNHTKCQDRIRNVIEDYQAKLAIAKTDPGVMPTPISDVELTDLSPAQTESRLARHHALMESVSADPPPEPLPAEAPPTPKPKPPVVTPIRPVTPAIPPPPPLPPVAAIDGEEDTTARCLDCPRTWTFTDPARLEAAAGTHETLKGHIVEFTIYNTPTIKLES